jgi:hypothetical protein
MRPRKRRRPRQRLNDCTGIRQLLAVAGANVSVQAIAKWSKRQRAAAITWAHEQIAAFRADKPGWSTSVFWPEHVSRANRDWRQPAANSTGS